MGRIFRSLCCRISCLLLAAFFCLPQTALADYDAKHPERLTESDIKAAACILIDAATGQVLFEKAADQSMYPASTTKIMTVLLALRQCGDTGESVLIGKDCSAASVRAQLDRQATVLGLVEGEKLPLLDLLYGAILRSGNDAALAIAQHVSGSEAAFVELMNETALALGMTGTHFVNPHGLHDEAHVTTARDLALLARAAMQDETFAKIAASASWRMSATNKHKQRTIYTRHRIMYRSWNNEANAYYYKYITGIKSGTTSQAGYCFVGSASKDGIELISVVLGSGSTTVWRDTKRLFAYGFSQY